MTETQPEQSKTASTAPVEDDPLAHLHKMSTTAGLGIGEYVAVNGTAVFALLLGLASALALLESLLLVIPLAGIVISIIALRQIYHSNGTQTGTGLVVLGLVLMLGFGGYVLTQTLTEGMRTRADRDAISAMADRFAGHVKAKEYDQAYQLFSTRFRQSVTPEAFRDRIDILNTTPLYGKLQGARTGRMQFQTDEATGAKSAVFRLFLDFEKTPERPFADDLLLRKEENQWRIETFTSLFPPASGPPGQGQGAGGS
jgi:hypothetical protein